jgi:predicted nuclease of restriction endonuclease-like RecB superfamily
VIVELTNLLKKPRNTSSKKTRNKFETRILKQLKSALKKIARQDVDVKSAGSGAPKVAYETVKIPYVIEGNYIPDFILTSKSKTIYLETKGHFRPEAKRKMVAVKKLHPHLDIRIVFYSSKRSDIRWAERHGFPYAIGDVPQEWVEELNAS